MTTYYEVEVTKTSKPVGNSQDNFTIFDKQTKQFASIKEVKEWLKEEYPTCKKVKMYNDDKNGISHHCGYIYCFKNSDISHNSEMWYQQDWVSVKEIKATTIIIK